MVNPIDGLNLNLYPAYLPEILYSSQAYPGVPDLRHLLASGYEPGAHRIPDADNVALIAQGKWQTRVTIPVSSYVWAVSGYCSDAAGYRVQVTDFGTRTPFWNDRIYHVPVTGQGKTVAGGAFPLVILDRPRLVIEPGLVEVQIENLATAANQIYFVLLTAEPARAKK